MDMSTSAAGPDPRTQRIDAVDGLRAIAMTMVVAQHCGLLPFGWTGVWLFFVISGYVITRGFAADAGDPRPFGARYAAFLGRRAVRIVPAYLLYLGAGVAVVAVAGGAADRARAFADLPTLLSFTHNWRMALTPGASAWGPFAHLWTLSVEQQFYLLYPLLVLLVPARAQVGLTVALVAAGPLLRWAWSAGVAAALDPAGARAFAVYAATPCHADAFLLGSLVARATPQALAAAGPRLWRAAVLVGAAYVVSYALVNRQLGARGVDLLRNLVSGVLWGQGREVWVYLVVDAFAVAVLVQALRGGRGARALAWAPLAWVGRVSYGGYLYHALVLWVAAQAVGGAVHTQPPALRPVLFVATWAVTVVLAGASWRWFEAPLARRLHAGRRAPRPAGAAAPQGVR